MSDTEEADAILDRERKNMIQTFYRVSESGSAQQRVGVAYVSEATIPAAQGRHPAVGQESGDTGRRVRIE
jgi:hypothetical protein